MIPDAFNQFFEELQRRLPEGARLVGSQFRGDPYEERKGKWRVKVFNSPDQFDVAANVYLCVSAMKQDERGRWRRKKGNFAAGMLLMIDDLGEGPGAKFPLSVLEAAPPTMLIETSPDNHQAIYLFDRPVQDADRFNALINAFIKKQFLDGRDPGMRGVNRVFRPPVGINGKAKYGGAFPVRAVEWAPERLFSVDSLVEAFGLDLQPPGRKLQRIPEQGVDGAIRHFKALLAEFRAAGMVKHDSPTEDDWISVQCPWVDEHTGGVDNGAALGLPTPENGWCGAFKCHHGACEEKAYRDVTDWVFDAQWDALERINAAAPKQLQIRNN